MTFSTRLGPAGPALALFVLISLLDDLVLHSAAAATTTPWADEETENQCGEDCQDDGESVFEALSSFLQIHTQQHRGPLGLTPQELRSDGQVNTSERKLEVIGKEEMMTTNMEKAPCDGFDCLKMFAGGPADPEYRWTASDETIDGTTAGVAWKGHLLEMTSQAFLSAKEVTRPLWKHPLLLLVPSGDDGENGENGDEGSSGTAPKQLFATVFSSFGDMVPGKSLSDVPSDDLQIAATIAAETRSPVAVLFQVPPGMEIVEEGNVSRAEDSLLVWGHEQFLRVEGASMDALVELAMVRAVRRAMDTISAFLGDRTSSSYQPRKFAVMGASKRGHLTYHTAAVDDRVVAIVPISRPINQEAFEHRLARCLGGMPWVGSIYSAPNYVNVMTPAHSSLLYGIIDPINYLNRYEKVHKLVIDATQDDFFLPDAASLFWDKLPGPKTYRAIPNERHIGGSPQTLPLAPFIARFLSGIVKSETRPGIDWALNRSSGSISVSLRQNESASSSSSSFSPSHVRLWQARTCSASPRRDFRLITKDEGEACRRCGIPVEGQAACLNAAVAWKATPLEQRDGQKSWEVQLNIPKDGTWLAAMVEFEFSLPGSSSPYLLSTEVMVVPDTFPYPDVDNIQNVNKTLVLAEDDSESRLTKEEGTDQS